MVQSMTGYGSFTIASDNYRVTVELKSLNSKYFELNLKLPRNYLQYELQLRNYLSQYLRRGKVSASLSMEVLNPDRKQLRINKDLVKSYHEELTSLQNDLKIKDSIDLPFLLSLPDAMKEDQEESDPEEWKLIELSFQNAARDLRESRLKEGKALERDLRIRVDLIGRHLENTEELVPQRVENTRARVLSSLQDLSDSFDIDGNRFEQELIYYIEKLDINEEVVRLKKHLEFFTETLNDEDSNGKKLGFIAQEMGREINTIGSKANDADIQVHVVRKKEELEKIKEQVLNIL